MHSLNALPGPGVGAQTSMAPHVPSAGANPHPSAFSIHVAGGTLGSSGAKGVHMPPVGVACTVRESPPVPLRPAHAGIASQLDVAIALEQGAAVLHWLFA
jgi:hypothetical protein